MCIKIILKHLCNMISENIVELEKKVILPIKCAPKTTYNSRWCIKISMIGVVEFLGYFILATNYSLVHIKVPKQTSLLVILGEINTILYCTKYSCKAPHLILLSILHSFPCNVFLFQRTKTKYHHVVHSWMVSTEIK